MATTTFHEYNGDGSDKTFDYSFPTYTAADVVVEIDGIVVDNYTIPSYATSGTKTVTFDNSTGTLNGTLCESDGSPKDGTLVRVKRDTNVDTAKATFAAGSSVKAGDLNNNQEQILRALQEEQNQKIDVGKIQDKAITSAKILDGSIVNVDINSAAEIAVSKLAQSGTDRQILQTNGANVEWTSNIDVPGTLDVTGVVDFDSTLNVDGAATFATVDINGGAIDGTTIGANSAAAGTFTAGTIATADINGGAIDGTVIGANSAAAGTFTTVTASGTITGTIAGNVTGDITGDISGNAGTATDLAAAAKITAAEQAAHSVNDTTYFTTSAAEARYFNASTSETIKNGDAFPDNDTTIATTAAINDRIIDLVDDVGGFVPIANETSFPNANPDVNNGTGTLVSIKALASNLTSNGSGVATIANGTVGNSTVTITGLENSTTYVATFGMIVETTTTLNTYTFHRYTPKATDVTAVAGKVTEIGRLGTAAAVEDMGILGTTDCVADMAILGTTDVVADLNTLGTADVVSDLNTLASSAVVSDLDTCATNVANINTVGGAITNVNAVATNISGVHHYADVYQVATSAPTDRADGDALEAGDMWFDSSSNKELKVHNGTSYQLVTPSQGVLDDIAIVSGNITFTEDLGLITDATSTGTGNSIETCADNITNINSVAADATDIGAVAGKATEIGRLGTVAAVADLAILGTTDVVADLNTLATSAIVSDLDTLADIAANITTVAGVAANVTTVAGISANTTTVAGISANVTTVAGVAANVTTVAGSIADVNRYANEYTIANSNPGSPSAGDLWYDSGNNVLKYYTGSAWASISAGISDIASDTSPELGGHLDCNDKNLTEVATVSGNNLQIDFGTLT